MPVSVFSYINGLENKVSANVKRTDVSKKGHGPRDLKKQETRMRHSRCQQCGGWISEFHAPPDKKFASARNNEAAVVRPFPTSDLHCGDHVNIGAHILVAFQRCDVSGSCTLEPAHAPSRSHPEPGRFESKVERLKSGLRPCAGGGSRTRTAAMQTRIVRSRPAPARPRPAHHWHSACAWCRGCRCCP